MNDLPSLQPSQFGKFFQALHEYEPFPWQQMLLEQCASVERWPDLIDLPTASGKTACIDVAVFLLALQADLPTDRRMAPRRIWFVVNRRIVVDEAYERAKKIANHLLAPESEIEDIVARRLKHLGGTGLPLAVARLRGGVPKQLAWSYHPAQPAVITSTVDQIGSRLLFRGYGVGRSSRPVHAALTGNDSLIVLDEAHTAKAFWQTIGWIKELRKPFKPLTPLVIVTMSATPPSGGRSELKIFPDRRIASQVQEALRHNLLDMRYNARKPAELIEVDRITDKNAPSAEQTADTMTGGANTDKKTGNADPLVNQAVEHAARFAAEHQRTAIMVNRVATAVQIAETLRAKVPKLENGDVTIDIVLLTGRMRPIDRDRLVKHWSPFLRAVKPQKPDRPIIVVTTQCLEVGADFSFDALVSECASLDALRQRFGRLNRLGESTAPSPAVILIRSDQHNEDAKLNEDKPLDPVYGNALARTWLWMNRYADIPAGGKGKKKTHAVIDMGVNHLKSKISDDAQLPILVAPAPDAPVLLPAYIDSLSQTGPAPVIEPDISLFLHGSERGQAEAFVVFRQDLDPSNVEHWIDTVVLMPPVTGEKLSVAIWRLAEWLKDGGGLDESSDIESEKTINERFGADMCDNGNPQPFVLYRGKSDITLCATVDRHIGPGDTIVLPAPWVFPAKIGTLGPDGRVDVYEAAFEIASAQRVLRIHPRVLNDGIDVARWNDLLGLASVADGDFDRRHFLAELQRAVPSLVDQKKLKIDGYPDGRGRVVFLPVDNDAQTELDPFAFDDIELLDRNNEVLLEAHTRRVAGRAAAFALRCLNADMEQVIGEAALMHDLGKADPRFQECLNNGRRFGRGQLLAKLRVDISLARWKQLCELAGLPGGFRHEMLSVQLANSKLSGNPNRDLILHLIASHHGSARPFAPICIDEQLPDVSVTVDKQTWIMDSQTRHALTPAHRLDSRTAERFWQLTRHYGWWGLAYLEAMLRLADWRASKEAE